MSSGSDLCRLTAEDRQAAYRQVAQLHAQGIDQGFLSGLGEGFLTLLYQAIDECESSALLVEITDEKITGFAACSRGMRPVYGQLLKRAPKLCLVLFPQLIKPAKLWGLFEVFRQTIKPADHGLGEGAQNPQHELLSIVVSPEMRGTGVAERLYQRLSGHLADSGAECFKIVVGKNLGPAHKFYQRMGAKQIGKTAVHGGALSTIYVQNLV